MQEADIPFVHEIEKICFDDPWSLASFKQQLESDFAHYLIAYIDEKIVGYACLWKFDDTGEIINFAVHPDFRGRGAGDALMHSCKEMCRQIQLEVRKSNKPAMLLYQKHGFTEIGIRKDYYKNPTEDAVIMNLGGENE